MLSATDFLPSSMTLFMNLDSTTSPKRGSGRISRRSGRRRRAMGNSFATASRRQALAGRSNSRRSERIPKDRKSGVEGKSVQERVDLGGRRIIKKKKKH